MKRILAICSMTFLMAGIIVSCENEPILGEPKFFFKQDVKIITGFARGFEGKIKSYGTCLDQNDKKSYCYSIDNEENVWNNIYEKQIAPR